MIKKKCSNGNTREYFLFLGLPRLKEIYDEYVERLSSYCELIIHLQLLLTSYTVFNEYIFCINNQLSITFISHV